MKVLLVAINSKYIHSSPAVRSIAAYNGEYSGALEVAEYTINNAKSYITSDIYKRSPDVVGISCYIWNYSYVREIVSVLGRVMPQVPIWLGGPEVTYNSEEVLETMPEAYGVIRGEGEETWRDLLAYYADKKGSLEDLRGITLRTGAGIRKNPDREPIDLDKLVLSYANKADMENRIVYYEGSRGCPYSCSYCLSSADHSLRYKSMEKVKRELDFFIENEVPQVKFTDRTFNCKHDYTKEIWRYIIKKDKGITNFHFEISADLLDKEEIELISGMRPGLIQLEVGVQSTNRETLEAINRRADLSRLRSNVEAIRAAGNTHIHLDLIAGLPHEGIESFEKSFNDVYSMKPHQFQVGFLKILKGTLICYKAEEYGIVYMDHPPYEVLETRDLSYGDLLRIKLVEEMTEIYYNSAQFKASLLILQENYESAFRMYLELGEYYESHGLLGLNHSRMARYSILRDFVIEKGFGNLQIIEDAMCYDLYLRERLKKRPEWAAPKEGFSSLYRDEKAIRKYISGDKATSTKGLEGQTHIERFMYDYSLWRDKCDYDTGEAVLLFDYTRRSPIDYSARIVKVEPEDIQ